MAPVEDSVLRSTRSAKDKGKAKGKTPKTRRNAQKAKYIFNGASKTTQTYLDYFNPDRSVENRLVGLPQSVIDSSLPVAVVQLANSYTEIEHAPYRASYIGSKPTYW